MRTIDLNCDMGEGCGNDDLLLELVSSANIACGFHAGSASIMRKTVEAAIRNNVAIGAHPSFPDRENFGRTNMELPPAEIFDIVVYQLGAMKAVCEAAGGVLNHVKPHGALYNQAARDQNLARVIAEAVRQVDGRLVLYGSPGSDLISEAERAGLKTASEVFADRTYQVDGSLTPRSRSDALIRDTRQSISQVLQMIVDGTVTATTGETIDVMAETICIHGDGELAVEFARALRQALKSEGIGISSIRRN